MTMNKLHVLMFVGLMAFGAFAELKQASVTFNPLATNLVTQVMPLTGEVVQIGIRSKLTNAFDLTISDFTTGTVIFSGTGLTSTSYNLVPRLAATGTNGASVTNNSGTIYVPANVVKVRVKAGNSNTTNDALTVSVVVNNSP